MRELYIGRRSAVSEDGSPCSFDYYILVDEMCVDGEFACESYGVKITALDCDESAALPNITVNISRIDELMDLLLRSTVTPSTLEDVVLDWIA